MRWEAGLEFLSLTALQAPSQNTGGVSDREVDPRGVCVHLAGGHYQSILEYTVCGSACSLLLGEERLFPSVKAMPAGWRSGRGVLCAPKPAEGLWPCRVDGM